MNNMNASGFTKIPKLYIATKMRDLTREEVQKKLNNIAAKLNFNPEEVEFVNLLSEDEIASKKPVECLGESIKSLAIADCVIIEKYEETRGVSCEEYICNEYRIPYTTVFMDEENLA